MWASIDMEQSKQLQTVVTEPINTEPVNEMFDDQDSESVEVDEMFKE